MDQMPTNAGGPASTRETVGDLALVVVGALSQIARLNIAMTDLKISVVEALDGNRKGAAEAIAAAGVVQKEVDESLARIWQDFEALMRRFAGEPDA